MKKKIPPRNVTAVKCSSYSHSLFLPISLSCVSRDASFVWYLQTKPNITLILWGNMMCVCVIALIWEGEKYKGTARFHLIPPHPKGEEGVGEVMARNKPPMSVVNVVHHSISPSKFYSSSHPQQWQWNEGGTMLCTNALHWTAEMNNTLTINGWNHSWSPHHQHQPYPPYPA